MGGKKKRGMQSRDFDAIKMWHYRSKLFCNITEIL
jgi:hypothetical protein